jgi:hypothetical protein
MSATSNLLTLLAIAGVRAAGLAVLKAKLAREGGGDAKFKPKQLLTPNRLLKYR